MSCKLDFSSEPSHKWPDYRAVWRWHFYAGLFCIPFVIMLSITGTIYLFKPQIEAWHDRPYDQLQVEGPAAGARAQIEAAVGAVSESIFQAYELPTAPASATRVLVEQDGRPIRVYVHPQSSQVLGSVADDGGFVSFAKKIHGELLIGDIGSHIVELAACWTIVMILSGLFLWWPRQAKGLGGVLYPRLLGGSRMFWRDIHGVTGMWISLFALFLVISGLPWANFWGEYFKGVRRLTGTAVAKQDWSTGSSESKPMKSGGEGGEHKNHGGGGGRLKSAVAVSVESLGEIDVVVQAAQPLGLLPPVLISPVAGKTSQWDVKSMTANRPQRVTLIVDGKSGEILNRSGFEDRHIIDRAVGTGIAIHEGAMFGWFNQLLGVITTGGLVLLSVSGIVLWWRRRSLGVLGAPVSGMNPRVSFGLFAIVVLLGAAMPLFGASLILVLLGEMLLLRRIPGVRRWLGLREPAGRLAVE